MDKIRYIVILLLRKKCNDRFVNVNDTVITFVIVNIIGHKFKMFNIILTRKATFQDQMYAYKLRLRRNANYSAATKNRSLIFCEFYHG